jgi:2'-5' RNA ligase
MTVVQKNIYITNKKNTMLKYSEFIKENNNQSAYGYVSIPVDIDLESLKSKIDPKDLSERGFSDNPHITLLFGLHDEVEAHDIMNIVAHYDTFDIEVNGIDIFENEEFDVLKLNVVLSKELKSINKLLSILPHTNDYDYSPHITIAYLKKGTGKKYIDKDYKKTLTGLNKVIYSDKDRNKEVFKIDDVYEIDYLIYIKNKTNDNKDISKEFIELFGDKLYNNIESKYERLNKKSLESNNIVEDIEDYYYIDLVDYSKINIQFANTRKSLCFNDYLTVFGTELGKCYLSSGYNSTTTVNYLISSTTIDIISSFINYIRRKYSTEVTSFRMEDVKDFLKLNKKIFDEWLNTSLDCIYIRFDMNERTHFKTFKDLLDDMIKFLSKRHGIKNSDILYDYRGSSPDSDFEIYNYTLKIILK